MSKKAVYSNKGLAIYITGEDFEGLLLDDKISVKVYIGKVETRKSFLWVQLSAEASKDLITAFSLEEIAIYEARDAGKKRRYISGRPLPKSNRS